jgi:acyl-CoA synthetase (AMP-forming)/AMP-acid ligase II
MKKLEKQDKVNVFYLFESHAKNPKTANKLFLLIPKDPEKPGQRTEWTYAEAYEIVLKWAAWLKERHGVQKQELIAMNFMNKPQFIWLWFALWSLGAVPVLINYNLREQAFVHSVRVSTTRLLIVDPDVKDVLTEDVASGLGGADEKGRAVEIDVVEKEVEDRILGMEPYRAPDAMRSGVTQTTTSLLIYTSGTTGLPKAARVSWSKPLSGVKFFATLLGLKPDDRYFTALPLYHSSGSVLGVLQVLGPGCTVRTSLYTSPRIHR